MTMKIITRKFTIKKINFSSLKIWSSFTKVRIDIFFLSTKDLKQLNNNASCVATCMPGLSSHVYRIHSHIAIRKQML